MNTLDDIRARIAAFVPAPLESMICGVDGNNQPFKMPLSQFAAMCDLGADELYLIQAALAIDGTAQIDTGNGTSAPIHLVTTAH